MLARRDLLRPLTLGALGAAWGRRPPAALAQAVPAGGDRRLFIARALAMRSSAEAAGDQPFGGVVVKDGRIIAEAPSRVVSRRDPTAHAEMEAIRDACARLGTRSLAGAELYGSSRACPMCEAAAYWAGVSRMFHGADGADAGAPRLGSC